jgi:large subunit ribosomal protein L29
VPILRIKEIREMSSEDRKKRLMELRTELIRLKTMIKAGGTIENPARIRQLRKTIARILTIENEEKTRPEKQKPKGKKKR